MIMVLVFLGSIYAYSILQGSSLLNQFLHLVPTFPSGAAFSGAKSLIFRCKITHYYRCKIPHFQMQNPSFSDSKSLIFRCKTAPHPPPPHPLPNTVPPKNKSTKKVFGRNISPGLIIRILWYTQEFSFLTVTASCETGYENLRHFAV